MVYIKFSQSTRFGNWLFQYAMAKSVSRDGSVAFFVDLAIDDAYVTALEKRFDVMRGAQTVRKLPERYEVYSQASLRSEGVPVVSPERDYLQIGVCQEPRLFDERLVRSLFRMPESVAVFIRERYGDVLAAPLRVSIHVRRGDYMGLPHRHPFVGKAYLKAAVEKFPSDALFVVCSDDLAWCKSFFAESRFPGRRFAFVEGGTVLSDFYMATFCHHNVMSNSTFSWWGAYLNPHAGKRVILPSHWFGMSIGRRASAINVSSLTFDGVEVIENGYDLMDGLKAVALTCRQHVGSIVRSALGG